MPKYLTTTELFRRGANRVSTFIELLKAEHLFETVDGRFINIHSVVFNSNEVYPTNEFGIYNLEERLRKTEAAYTKKVFRYKIEVTGLYEDGSVAHIPISGLKKTHLFGGRCDGYSIRRETIELNRIQENIEALKKAKSVDFIKFQVNNRVYDITSAESTTGNPKSDFHLLDSNGDPVVFVSHKTGYHPRHVQQWGGMTESSIKDHPEVQRFVDVVKNLYDKLPPATTIGKKIISPKLKNMSMYGVEYGSSPGINNVDLILQGEVEVMSNDFGYYLSAHRMYCNGQPPSPGFEPTLMAIYKGPPRNDFGISCARFVIQPFKSRKVHILLNSKYKVVSS